MSQLLNVCPDPVDIVICRGDSLELSFDFPDLNLTGFAVTGAISDVSDFDITEVDYSIGKFTATFDNTDTDLPVGTYTWKIVATLLTETWTIFGGKFTVR